MFKLKFSIKTYIFVNLVVSLNITYLSTCQKQNISFSLTATVFSVRKWPVISEEITITLCTQNLISTGGKCCVDRSKREAIDFK